MTKTDTPFFVTGMLRSGTTLLEKLLCNHPLISVLSQPFPYLFFDVKRRFLQRLGEHDLRYPLGDLFLESRYATEEFTEFLRDDRVERSRLRALFTEMSSYSGQSTRFDPEALDKAANQLGNGDLAETLAFLYHAFAHKAEARLFGGKETLCEEFLPYLLERGYYCLLVIRDPRDIIASLNHGRGREFGGRRKPTLFNVRGWRKSVAFALHLETHPRFAWLRYEDLIAESLELLNRVAQRLGITPFMENFFAEGIRDQSGKVWGGNSSHGVQQNISSSSVGRYREVLPAPVIDFVEATCYPELQCLGYPISCDWQQIPGILRSSEEPYPVEREELRHYASDPARVTEEISRLKRLSLNSLSDHKESLSYFIFEDVYQILQRAVASVAFQDQWQ